MVTARKVQTEVRRSADRDERRARRNKYALETDAAGLAFPRGRLTLALNDPVPIANQAAKTSVYYTPYNGDVLPIYNGTVFVTEQFEELELPLDSNAAHAGYQQGGSVFDCFVFVDETTVVRTVRLATGPVWSTLAVRGTGAGTTELQRVSGIWTNRNEMLLRYGTAAGNTFTANPNEASYVGTFSTTASDGETEDTEENRRLWNTYNRVPRHFLHFVTEDSYTYSSTTFRPFFNDVIVRMTIGLRVERVEAVARAAVRNSSATPAAVEIGIGVDNATINSAQIRHAVTCDDTIEQPMTAEWSGYPGIGSHYLRPLEKGAGTADTQTWLGDNGGTMQSGISGHFWA